MTPSCKVPIDGRRASTLREQCNACSFLTGIDLSHTRLDEHKTNWPQFQAGVFDKNKKLQSLLEAIVSGSSKRVWIGLLAENVLLLKMHTKTFPVYLLNRTNDLLIVLSTR